MIRLAISPSPTVIHQQCFISNQRQYPKQLRPGHGKEMYCGPSGFHRGVFPVQISVKEADYGSEDMTENQITTTSTQ